MIFGKISKERYNVTLADPPNSQACGSGKRSAARPPDRAGQRQGKPRLHPRNGADHNMRPPLTRRAAHCWELGSCRLQDDSGLTEILSAQQKIAEIGVIGFDLWIFADCLLKLNNSSGRVRRHVGPALLSQHHDQQERGRHP